MTLILFFKVLLASFVVALFVRVCRVVILPCRALRLRLLFPVRPHILAKQTRKALLRRRLRHTLTVALHRPRRPPTCDRQSRIWASNRADRRLPRRRALIKTEWRHRLHRARRSLDHPLHHLRTIHFRRLRHIFKAQKLLLPNFLLQRFLF